MTAMPKHKTFRDKSYIASFKKRGAHRCMITGAEMPDGAHIRYGEGGMGMKPGDDLIIPISHRLHAEQHRIGEIQFWVTYFWQLPLYRVWAAKAEVKLSGDTKHDTMLVVKQIARDYYKEWSEI